MKKIDKKYKILISIILLVLSLTLLKFTVGNRNLTPPEKILKDTGLLIENMFYKPINFIQRKINDIEIADKSEEMLLKEQRRTIEELKKLLNITYTTEDYEEIGATVIKRNLDNFYETIILNKGEKDDVKEGMAVVASGGIIGLVSTTSYQTCTVKLLTSSFPLSVKIRTNENEIYGILKEYKDNYYIVEGISENTSITGGMEVVTTGLGYPIPSGILIGTVAKEERDHFDLNRTIYITPSIEVDKIYYVKILKRNIK